MLGAIGALQLTNLPPLHVFPMGLREMDYCVSASGACGSVFQQLRSSNLRLACSRKLGESSAVQKLATRLHHARMHRNSQLVVCCVSRRRVASRLSQESLLNGELLSGACSARTPRVCPLARILTYREAPYFTAAHAFFSNELLKFRQQPTHPPISYSPRGHTEEE